MYKDILYQVKDRVATITFNRPEAGNAFSGPMYDEVIDAFNQSGTNESVGAIVVTGAGKHFSAGGDIRSFRKLIDEKTYLPELSVAKTGRMSMAIRRCPKPVIAMHNGAAAGAGGGVALASDFRIMTPKSSLIMAFINLGLTGDTASFYSLCRTIGTARAQELMMLGKPLTGEKALELGLATQLVEQELLEETTYQLANKLANGPTKAYGKQKEILYEFFFKDIDEFSYKEARNMRASSMTEDFDEAVNAFLEKRSPTFKGR